MSRLILCGAVVGALALLAVPWDDDEEDSGIVLVEASTADSDHETLKAERAESLEGSDRSLAQIWLVAFGAAAFFLLELLNPLGIFYGNTPQPEPEKSRRRQIPERRGRFGVPAA